MELKKSANGSNNNNNNDPIAIDPLWYRIASLKVYHIITLVDIYLSLAVKYHRELVLAAK